MDQGLARLSVEKNMGCPCQTTCRRGSKTPNTCQAKGDLPSSPPPQQWDPSMANKSSMGHCLAYQRFTCNTTRTRQIQARPPLLPQRTGSKVCLKVGCPQKKRLVKRKMNRNRPQGSPWLRAPRSLSHPQGPLRCSIGRVQWIQLSTR